MKHELTKSVKNKIRVLFASVALLCISQGVWGTTYYLLWMGSPNSGPTSFSSEGSRSGTSSWTWTLTGSFSTGTDYYFAISTSDSYTGIIYTSARNGNQIEENASLLSARDAQNWNVGDDTYYYYRISLCSAQTTLTITCNGVDSYTITNDSPSPTPSSDAPIVRIGKQLKEITAEGANKGKVRVSGYVASTNCSNITKITVYYANNSAFRNQGNNKAYSFEHTLATPVTANNNVTEDILLTQAQVAQVVGKGETLYVRITATNAAGETSAYSDMVSLTYNYDQFVVAQPFTQSVKACKGEHQFKWTGEDGLFNPRPGNYTVKFNNSSGDDASSEFEIDGDYMVWKGAKKYSYNDDSQHAHVYYFTASKNEYSPANATVTLNLKAEELSGETVTIKDGAGSVEVTDVSVEPWTLLKLTATKTGGTAIEWSAPEELLMTVEDSGSAVYIKGTQASGVAYTVTARPVTSTCGASTPTEVKIKVDVVAETCTNN